MHVLILIKILTHTFSAENLQVYHTNLLQTRTVSSENTPTAHTLSPEMDLHMRHTYKHCRLHFFIENNDALPTQMRFERKSPDSSYR